MSKKSFDSILRDAGIKPAEREIAWRKHLERESNAKPANCMLPRNWPSAFVPSDTVKGSGMQFGLIAQGAVLIAQAAHPRVQNWLAIPSAADEFGKNEKHVFVGWKEYTRSKSFPRFENHVYYRSLARINPCGNLALWKGHTQRGKLRKRRLPAPSGYIWRVDSNGLFMTAKAGGGKYHPTAEEMLQGSVNAIRAKVIAANAVVRRQRAEAKVAARAIKAEMARIKNFKRKVIVTMQDSKVAGNCAAGTESFRRRHNISATGIEIGELLKIVPASPGEARQIRAACLAAIRRNSRPVPDQLAVTNNMETNNTASK